MNYKPSCRPRGTDKAEIMTVIHTQSIRGTGLGDDLIRLVDEYWTLDGTLLAENDSLATSLRYLDAQSGDTQ